MPNVFLPSTAVIGASRTAATISSIGILMKIVAAYALATVQRTSPDFGVLQLASSNPKKSEAFPKK